jgi:hypothetical protein
MLWNLKHFQSILDFWVRDAQLVKSVQILWNLKALLALSISDKSYSAYPGVEVHTCNSNTWDIELGASQVQGQNVLDSETLWKEILNLCKDVIIMTDLVLAYE